MEISSLRMTLTFIDISTSFAKELHHFLRAERRGPIQQSLANVVHKIHFKAATEKQIKKFFW